MTHARAKTINRREFIHMGVGTGFALAVLPVTAWAVSTSGEGITAGTVGIPLSGGRTLPAYRAFPKGKGPFPVVLVIHEIFGVHEHIQDVCRRLAHEGYFAVSPYLYFREGQVGAMPDISKIISDVVSKVPQAQVWSDLDATVDWLSHTKAANVSQLGVTGFCWGGAVTWMYASQQPKVKAGVAWYGKLTAAATPIHSKFPLDIAPTLRTPVLGLYGGKDAGIPLTDVEKMKALLKAGPSRSEIIVYPEAEHGFHADYRPSYHKESALDGWKRMLAWFRAHGVGSRPR